MALEDVEERRSSLLDSREWCLVNNSDSSSTDLYGELQITAEKCKILADKLQKTAAGKDLTIEKGTQTNGCCEEARTKLMESVAENLRLRQSLKDVSDINHRWQDYNYDRQKHMQNLLSTVLELRSTIDEMKMQSVTLTSVLPQRSKAENQIQSEEHLTTTADLTAQKSQKPTSPSEETEKNKSDKQSASFNEKLLHEIRALSRQLKEAKNESKELQQQLAKLVEENDNLRILLKSYKSDWEDENRKKVEALSQAQRVVQELCALRANCQMQAEKLMKMGTVSFNCSLCQSPQNRQALNNLNSGSQLEGNTKVAHKEKHKKLARATATIIHSIDGTEVHLLERGAKENTGKRKPKHRSYRMVSEDNANDSKNPIITFPESDSDEQTTLGEESCVQLATSSQHLICPVCMTCFPKEHGLQFLDHYTQCKVSPVKHVS